MNVGIIGCGFIGQKHLKSLSLLEGIQLVAVCDITHERMEQMIAQYVAARPFVNKNSVQQYLDFEKLLADPNVEVVVITTISGLHAQMVIRALQHGKHVIVEKPMTLSIKEARAINLFAKEKGKKLAVCHQKRFFPHLQQISQLVRDGGIGRLILGGVTLCYNRDDHYYREAKWRGSWEMDGGVLLNQAIHNVDLLLWMMNDPKTVQGEIDRLMRPIEAEDTALVMLRMQDRSFARIEATVCADRSSSYERLFLIGTKGSFSLTGKFLEKVENWQVEGTAAPVFEMINPYRSLYLDFQTSLQADREPYVNGTEGMKALEVLLAAYQSAKLKTPVELPLSDFSTLEMKNFF